MFFCVFFSLPGHASLCAGDSMMYQHTVSGIGCSGNSPTSTPPNINACSSSTPPLANSNHQNNNSSHENNSDQLVRMKLVALPFSLFVSYTYIQFKAFIVRHTVCHTIGTGLGYRIFVALLCLFLEPGENVRVYTRFACYRLRTAKHSEHFQYKSLSVST